MAASSNDCTVHKCARPALPVTRCGRHLCDAHSDPKYHPCLYIPPNQRSGKTCRDNHPLFGLLADIVDAPIATEAATFRGDPTVTCTLELPTLPGMQKEYRGLVKWMGYRNLALTVAFSDGVRWLARIRLTDVYTPQVRRGVMLSEYATLKALNDVVPGKVPRVYLPSDDQSQLIYFFEEFVGGKSLHTLIDADGVRTLTPAVKRAIGDYAEFMIKVSSKQFSGVGCLYPDALAGFVVGPLLSDIRSKVPTLGTYRSSQDMHLARIDAYLLMVHVSPLRPPELASQPVRILRYLVALELRDLVSECTTMASVGPTFIKHTDDAAHNMLGENGRIDSIIDWEMAIIVPFAEAFTAPLAFLTLDEASLKANRLSKAEEALAAALVAKGREDLAAAVRGGRRYHYLIRLYDGPAIPGASTDITLGSVWGTRLAFLEEAAGTPPKSLDEWYADALTKYAHDAGFEETIGGLVHWAELNADLASAAADEVESDIARLEKVSSEDTIAFTRAIHTTLKASNQAKRSANAARMFAADCRAGVGPAKLAAKRLHDSKHGFRKFVSSVTDKLRHSDSSASLSRSTSKPSLSRTNSKSHALSRSSSRLSRTQSRNSAHSRSGSPTRKKPPKASDHYLEDLAAVLAGAASQAESAAARADEVAEKGLAAVNKANAVVGVDVDGDSGVSE